MPNKLVLGLSLYGSTVVLASIVRAITLSYERFLNLTICKSETDQPVDIKLFMIDDADDISEFSHAYIREIQHLAYFTVFIMCVKLASHSRSHIHGKPTKQNTFDTFAELNISVNFDAVLFSLPIRLDSKK
jgi:hypothetical protein